MSYLRLIGKLLLDNSFQAPFNSFDRFFQDVLRRVHQHHRVASWCSNLAKRNRSNIIMNTAVKGGGVALGPNNSTVIHLHLYIIDHNYGPGITFLLKSSFSCVGYTPNDDGCQWHLRSLSQMTIENAPKVSTKLLDAICKPNPPLSVYGRTNRQSGCTCCVKMCPQRLVFLVVSSCCPVSFFAATHGNYCIKPTCVKK